MLPMPSPSHVPSVGLSYSSVVVHLHQPQMLQQPKGTANLELDEPGSLGGHLAFEFRKLSTYLDCFWIRTMIKVIA